MPEISPLAIGLMVLAVFVVFGPKPNFNRKKSEDSIDLSHLAASQHAAGRAPSPLRREFQFDSEGQQETVPQAAAAQRPAPLKVPDHY